MDETSQVFVQSCDPDVTQDGCFDDANQKEKKKTYQKDMTHTVTTNTKYFSE